MAFVEPLESNFGEIRGVPVGTERNSTSGIAAANGPAGVFMCRGAAQALTLPATAADVSRCEGVSKYTPMKAQNVNGLEYEAGDQLALLSGGCINVISEEAMTGGQDVYVRHTANGVGKLQLGAIRNDSDGGSVVTFLVNSAANGETVSVTLDGITFAALGDGTATVAEIAIALAAKIDAHAAYTCPVPGAATFVVTKADGTDIVLGGVSSTITATSGATCAKLPRARVKFDSTSTNPCVVEVNLP